jgi:hypothetical protein
VNAVSLTSEALEVFGFIFRRRGMPANVIGPLEPRFCVAKMHTDY